MVAKFETGSNLYGALKYNTDKIDEAHAKVLCGNLVNIHEDGRCYLNELEWDFNVRLKNPNMGKTEKPIVTISLNPSPEDVLTDEQLREIAQEYMDRMGCSDQPYVVFKHEDIDRHHVHIVTTNIGRDGKKLTDSFGSSNDHHKSKEITNDIERTRGLHPADLKKDQRVWVPEKVDVSKGRIGYQVRNIVGHVLESYKIESDSELAAALAVYNVNMQIVKGQQRDGKLYRGIIYCPTDDSGNKVATPLKASVLGKKCGFERINKELAKGAKTLKSVNKDSIKGRLTDCMSRATNREELHALLREQGIDLFLRANEQGRIYGATIIDHEQSAVLNGSKVGKEFAANTFHQLISGWSAAAAAQAPTAPQASFKSEAFEPIQHKHDDGNQTTNLGEELDTNAQAADVAQAPTASQASFKSEVFEPVQHEHDDGNQATDLGEELDTIRGYEKGAGERFANNLTAILATSGGGGALSKNDYFKKKKKKKKKI
ncbi:MAG: relaxase/mobilization nuclease domain-containing protein [Prevotellaceae bacterium]|jgi:hypothetical protein|nr:relaxase/mobilization nuclease domain-containing protein [Prevotellaceae bacterium]